MEKISEKSNHQIKMNEFIDLIEKIEEAGIKDYIELPRFCIIGGLSCGKSSVVENNHYILIKITKLHSILFSQK